MKNFLVEPCSEVAEDFLAKYLDVECLERREEPPGNEGEQVEERNDPETAVVAGEDVAVYRHAEDVGRCQGCQGGANYAEDDHRKRPPVGEGLPDEPLEE